MPILVTPSGIVIEAKLVQPEKAEPPILVTLSGIVIEVKLVQPEKALVFILVVRLSNVTSVNAPLDTDGAKAIKSSPSL